MCLHQRICNVHDIPNSTHSQCLCGQRGHGECQVVAGANPPEAVLKKALISEHSRVKFETGNQKARRGPMFSMKFGYCLDGMLQYCTEHHEAVHLQKVPNMSYADMKCKHKSHKQAQLGSNY